MNIPSFPYVITSISCAAFLASCAAGPDYRKPLLQIPSSWQETAPSMHRNDKLDDAALATWWQTLNDPLLSSLVDEAAANNHDLKLAAARLREARARRGVVAVNWFPVVKLGAGASRNDASDDGGGHTTDSFSAQLDASWEADIFGIKRRSREGAAATEEAAVENARDIRVSLLAEVVLAYLDIRSAQARIDISRSSVAMLEETLQIVCWRREAGVAGLLDEEQARFNLEQVRAQLPGLEGDLARGRNNLALLLGRDSGAMKELDAIAPLPSPPVSLAVGVPAEVLRRRPDVRKAERELAAATAQTGAAEAARYPDLSLSGVLGLQSKNLATLFQPGAIMYSLAANTLLTVFDGGRLQQQVEIQNALQEQSLLTYQKTVRAALRDVENALTAYAAELNRRTALRAAHDAAARAVALSENSYQAGVADFITVLDSQRSLLTLKEQLALNDAAIIADLARLYKALGGGWSVSDVPGGKQ